MTIKINELRVGGNAAFPKQSHRSAWLYTPKRLNSPLMRLFCFPHAGGNATTFRDWTHILPETIEVSAIQLPGRGARLYGEPCSDIAVATQAVVAAIKPLLSCPCAFFGHSLGAVIAFEVLRMLRLNGSREPIRFFVAGCGATPLLCGRSAFFLVSGY